LARANWVVPYLPSGCPETSRKMAHEKKRSGGR
jgi:hypothetical protein